MRRLLAPSWLARHLLAVVLVGLFARLGWWQLVKGRSGGGTIQNLFYGAEWPLFAAMVIWFWWQMVRDELWPERRAKAPRAAGDGTTGPRPAAAPPPRAEQPHDDEEDEELAAYNRYLASLYERDSGAPNGAATRPGRPAR